MLRAPTLDTTQKEMDFFDSSFFATGKSLPSPQEVIALSSEFTTNPRPAPIKFEELGLLVKFGHHVAVDEALCLRALRQSPLLAKKIPVPEVYGWRVHPDTVLIYMELIRGDTIQDRWDSLSKLDKASICDQLREIVSSLREVKQDPGDSFIGSISHQHLRDYVFHYMPRTGPFKNVKEFNDWFSFLPQHWLPESRRYQDPDRHFLPDTAEIKFTHGDLHVNNIMISSTGPPRILAVFDWAHAGWYPEYWEYCKACYTSHCEGEWRNVWMPKFLTPYGIECHVFGNYVLQMGAV
ncbi:hypothetical protein LOZ53_005640 [Ophidiomyces ophidiicola]|nr:hypothetical protein LOZ55_002898 [Ophidiomyces ophidiicola]KAI1983982.1 hypothetical protein LOZ53_005640 [Ophidiomyces ophidiicola]KAI1984736.1 hypothetical protein LOZ54_004452 [Ophidiomyces ophidiicola]KAI1985483.1 hypothetical protein LOZ51_006396 [Ophidiomyces ophidiicola]